jgi:hypothetical protein
VGKKVLVSARIALYVLLALWGSSVGAEESYKVETAWGPLFGLVYTF